MSEAEVCQLGVVPILKEKLLRRWRNGSAGGRLARARLADADDDDDVPGTASEQAQLGLLVGGLQGRRRRRDGGGQGGLFWKSGRFSFPPKKILNGNLRAAAAAAAAHPN